MSLNQQKIIDYYEKCEVAYCDVWDLEHSLAMHYGYWETGVRTLPQALAKMNEILAHIAQVQTQEYVLDAGCGVGGSAIFLAKTFDCYVEGITLLNSQVDKAKKYAQQHGVAHRAKFSTQDYTHTHFASETFDLVWAVESVCHAPDKQAFLHEAYRLLKKDGRLLVSDGFYADKAFKLQEKQLLHTWTHGWAIPGLASVAEFETMLHEVGFRNVYFQDLTANILPSSKRLYFLANLALAYGYFCQLIGKKYGNPHTLANTRSAKAQYQALRKGLWKYGVFRAQK